jgi:hypothetical protein
LTRRAAGAALVAALAAATCRHVPEPGDRPHERTAVSRPIEDVVRDQAPALMKLPGVVGVYQGARDDGSPVIRVMLVDADSGKARRVPRTLEGWPVETEVTGPIRPLSDSTP